MKTKFIVQTARAFMPSSCWGTYYRVAVIEVKAEFDKVAMISGRARGVVRIVDTWEKCSGRGGENTTFAKAKRAAEAMAEVLNWSNPNK